MRAWLRPVPPLIAGLLLHTATPGGAQQIATLCDRKGANERGSAVSVDVVYFQGPCQKKLVPGKDATVRVYLFWKRIPDKATVERYEATVTLSSGGGEGISCTRPPGTTTIQRPDLYDDSDRRAARNSVNFFGCDLDGVQELRASVRLRNVDIYGNATGEATTYPGSQAVQHMASAQKIRAKVVFPTVGGWSDGVPRSAIAKGTTVLQAGRVFALQNLPVGEVDLDIAGSPLQIVEPHLQSDPDLSDLEADEEWTVRVEPCPALPEETCRTFVEEDPLVDDEVSPELWLKDELRSRWDGDAAHLVIAWVPEDFQGGWAGVNLRTRGLSLGADKNTLDVASRTPTVILLRADANAATAAHELGHYLGLPHHDGTIVAGKTREVEGFLSTSTSGANKSYVEGNGDDRTRLFSLMVEGKPGEGGPDLNFIMNTQYEALADDLEDEPLPSLALGSWIDDTEPVRVASTSPPSLRARSAVEADPTVLVRGVVAADGSAGRLRAVEWLPGGATEEPGSSGVASVEFVDGGGRTLASVPVSEDLRTTANNETIDEGAIRFALPVARPEGARAVRLVSTSGKVLAEVAARGSAPVVRVLSPTNGESWAPGMPIRWEASDPERGAVAASVYYSADGGAGGSADWTPLVIRSGASAVTLARLRPGPDPVLVVAATDGFSVSADTARIDVRMPVQVVGAHPAEGDTVKPGVSLQIGFTSEPSEASRRRGGIEVVDPSGTPVPSETNWLDGGATAQLVPAEPLDRGVRYTVRISDDLEDRWGHSAASKTSWTFDVEPDLDPPRIEWTVPRDGAIAVPSDIPVSLRFSEALDPRTVEGIRLRGPGRTTVPAEISWDPDRLTLLLVPEVPLDGAAAYRVSVPDTVTDIAGNRLESAWSWSFTTR